MQRTLETYGYDVVATTDVKDALHIVEQHTKPIDLLLSDVIMPEMNGPELAQRIIRLIPTIKVLYVSGFTRQAAFDRGGTGGRTCFLEKPFAPGALAAKVRECLDRPPTGAA